MRRFRHGHATVLIATTLVLTSCGMPGAAAPASTATPPATQASASPSPTPSPTPEAVGLRDVDLTTGKWVYSPGGYSAPIPLDFVDGSATVETVVYTMTEPVYADANGDGLDDALVAIESLDGNGWESLWYVFVADGASAVQVAVPVARASRCGDAVTATAASPDGFIIDQTLRLPFYDDALSCAEAGTGVQRRTVAIAGTDATLWPVQTEPVVAWGGLCPGTEWLDTEPTEIELLAAPTPASGVANAADSPTGVFPPRTEPWDLLTAATGVTSEEWAFVGFIPTALPESETVRVHCAWALRP